MQEPRRDGWPKDLPEFLGWQPLGERDGVWRCRMPVRPEHIAGNGYLHATCVMGLADLCCAGGTFATIPEGASFTTVELKINLLGTAREGSLLAEATLEHGGRTTQVWDCVVTSEPGGRRIALFRCTQLILHPRP